MKLVEYFELRLQFISDISKDAAQVFFATFVAESFIKSAVNWNTAIWGLGLTIASWGIGIISFKLK